MKHLAINLFACVGISLSGLIFDMTDWAEDDSQLNFSETTFLIQETDKAPPTDKRDRSTSPTTPVNSKPLIKPRQPDGDNSVKVTGESKVWHKITLSLNGPYAHEQDNDPNPFTDYRMEVEFRHRDGTTYRVPGFFAADGNAGETSAVSGTQWRAHFAPDREGPWTYSASIVRGTSTLR